MIFTKLCLIPTLLLTILMHQLWFNSFVELKNETIVETIESVVEKTQV
jgi:hypothetical protein